MYATYRNVGAPVAFIALLVVDAQGSAQSLYIWLHHGSEFGLADAADGGILVEHTDVVEIAELAEDAELRELGDTRDEGVLQFTIDYALQTLSA